MIKQLLGKLKLFFKKKQSKKRAQKICVKPFYNSKLKIYIPCGKCEACKEIYNLVKMQQYLEKYKRSNPWVIEF